MTTITKQTKHMGLLEFEEIGYQTSKEIIINNHYSHTWNTAFGKINIGVFRDKQLLGVAVFGNMMNPNGYKSIADINKNEIIELNRLWISDELGHNAETIMLGACWKIIRKDYPHIKLVQSFADGRLGCGTIYKASNFKYYGYTKSLFFENKYTLDTYHQATLNNSARLKSMISRNRYYLDNQLTAFYVKTYRYIYVLDKKVNIKLKEQEYPKYDIGVDKIEYKHPDTLLAKLAILYEHLGEYDYSEKAISQMKDLDQLKIQQENKYIKAFIEKENNK